MKLVSALFLLAFISTNLWAQETSIGPHIFPTEEAPTDNIDWANFENEIDGSENWAFYQNKEGTILYIDFEKIGKKMERLVLKNEEKTVVKSDYELFDLPINTIYELNLENLPRGT